MPQYVNPVPQYVVLENNPFAAPANNPRVANPGVNVPYSRIDSFEGPNWRFLSNYASPLIENKTLEHHFQAAKTLDPAEQAKILAAPTPSEAKRLGNACVLRPDWENIKIPVMKELLLRKFSTPNAKEMLLSTGDAFLVEGNTWHDTFWGECKCKDHKGEGDNYLGLLLMEVRDELA
jgi:ribA/ribD-fused uncharacterized protein